MAQFDVYENPNEQTKGIFPYLLDVQSDLLAGLESRVVVPLIAVQTMGQAIKHLNPELIIDNVSVVMSTAELAGVPLRVLGKNVGSLKNERDKILSALDFLFLGF